MILQKALTARPIIIALIYEFENKLIKLITE